MEGPGGGSLCGNVETLPDVLEGLAPVPCGGLDTCCPFSLGHKHIPSPCHTGKVTAEGTIHWAL